MSVVCVSRIKDWAEQMQKELITLVDEASGMQHLVQVRLIALKGSSTEAEDDDKRSEYWPLKW